MKKQTQTIFDELIEAERAEKAATARRISLEEEIFEYVKNEKLLKKEEGQETIEELGFSITVNQPVTYKLDEEKYRALAESLPLSLQIHRIKLELDKTKFNMLKENPESKKYIKQIQNCVTSKPGKISIKVKKN